MAVAPGRCPDCGFDAPSVSPSDAVAAARSYPRRFRGLLVRPDDDDPEIVHRRPAPGVASAVDHAAAAAAGMSAAARALERVRVHEGAGVDLGPPPGPGRAVAGVGDGLTLEDVLAVITRSAAALAASAEAVHGDEWARTGVLPDGTSLHALDMARAGVHAGSHHLRAADRVLSQVRLLR